MYSENINKDWTLWVTLHQCTEMTARCRDKELQQHGISVMQSALMRAIIVLGKPSKIAEISKYLRREPPTIVVLVERMIKRGLLEEVPTDDLSRGKSYTVTEKGLTATRNSMPSNCLKSIFFTLTDKEKDLMISLMNAVLKNSVDAYYGAKASKYY